MPESNTICEVVENALCTACGACSGICPSRAITMQWNPAGYLVSSVDETKCNSCGLCKRVCPSVPSNRVVGEASDPFHGTCLKAYIGHATDAGIRASSQSGGIVTALLGHLLDHGLVDGTIVNRFCDQTKRNRAVFATTKEELLHSAGSYYCQSAVVEEILRHSDRRLAAVVLGCQAESLSLIRNVRPDIALPEFTIGLICAGQYSSCFVDQLIALSGAPREQVTYFRFRDKQAGSWPGNIRVRAEDCDYTLDMHHRLALKPAYEAYRCLLCFDQMCVHGDIVAGDPWGIDDPTNKKGNTVIVTRTEKGQRLVDEAVASGCIAVSELPIEDVIRGQTIDGRQKTKFFTAMKACRDAGLPQPVSERDVSHISHIEANPELWRGIQERLRYSRTIYLENETHRVEAIRSKKIRKIKRKQAWQWILRAMSFPFRRVRRLLNKR